MNRAGRFINYINKQFPYVSVTSRRVNNEQYLLLLYEIQREEYGESVWKLLQSRLIKNITTRIMRHEQISEFRESNSDLRVTVGGRAMRNGEDAEELVDKSPAPS